MSAHAVCSTCVEAPAVVVRIDNATSTTSCACCACDARYVDSESDGRGVGMRREARAREAGGARNRSMWITRALPLEIRANARSTGWDICIVFICVVYTRERARSDVDGGATGGTTRDERPHRGRPNHTLTHGTLVYERRANQKRGRQTTSRVALRPPSASANDQLACDVCQMNPAYVICHEDRAFLCRVCDVSIHDANSQSKSHQRFLFGNTRVDLEAMGAGEEVGRRVRSPSDSAAEHARVPDFEEEETGRQPKRQNRKHKGTFEDGAVPSMDEVAPGVFENFMTGLLGEEEGKKVLTKSSADENDFWGDIFSENWAAMESGMLGDDYTVPDFDQQVPNAMF